MKISNIQNCCPSQYRINHIKPKTSKTAFTGNFGVYNFSCENEYEQYAKDFWDKLQDNKEKIYDYLDSCIVNFEGEDDSFINHFKKLFEQKSEKYVKFYLLHKTHHAEDIIKEGFDFSKINTTKFGPGMYFAGGESELLIYSGKILVTDFEGIMADGRNLEKYSRLLTPLINEIRNYFGMGFDFTPTMMTEIHVLVQFAHQYARNLIVNKLNIDGATCYNNCYSVIFNPNALSNIRNYR